MNNTSSRSHAIFSVILKQQYTLSSNGSDTTNDSNATKSPQRSPSDQTTTSTSSTSQIKKLVSKFHFVDLAGSERVKIANILCSLTYN